MSIHETTFNYYALSIKGGYYNHLGQIVNELNNAKLFTTQEEAKAFRKIYDSTHWVTESTLLRVHLLLSEVDYEI